MLATRQRFCWLVCAALSMPSSMAFADDSESRSEWPMFGQNLQNTASNAGERKISTLNVAMLAPKWVATTGGDVSARAAVVDGVVYFPDWGGNVWALDAKTSKDIWQHQLSDYGLPAGTISRTSPAVQDDTVYIGTGAEAKGAGAYLLAINAKTGVLRWKTPLDTSTGASLTSSPAVLDEVVYTGVSGNPEETAAADDSNKCCMFRGSAVAVSARTGAILWQTYRRHRDILASVCGEATLSSTLDGRLCSSAPATISAPRRIRPMSTALKRGTNRSSACRATTTSIRSSRSI